MRQDKNTKVLFSLGKKKNIWVPSQLQISLPHHVVFVAVVLISLENHKINCLYTTNQGPFPTKRKLQSEQEMRWKREERWLD